MFFRFKSGCLFKVISVVIIQFFLLGNINISFAGVDCDNTEHNKSTLAPQLQMNVSGFSELIAAKLKQDSGFIKGVKQLKEQRIDMPEEAKFAVMSEMENALIDFFGNRADFELVENWEEFEGAKKPFTLVEVEGGFHLISPLGDAFWGWSNASPKIAFGTQSANAKDLRKISEITVALFAHTKNNVAAKLGMQLPQISDKETAALRELFGYVPVNYRDKIVGYVLKTDFEQVNALKEIGFKAVLDGQGDVSEYSLVPDVETLAKGFAPKSTTTLSLSEVLEQRLFNIIDVSAAAAIEEDCIRKYPTIKSALNALAMSQASVAVSEYLQQLEEEDFDGRLRNLFGKSLKYARKLDPYMTKVAFDLDDKKEPNRTGWSVEMINWLLQTEKGQAMLAQVIEDGRYIRDNYKYVIFAGMGGSSLSVDFVDGTFGEKGQNNIYALSSTDPEAIRNVLKNITERESGDEKAALSKTLIIPISKSGTTGETVSHKNYFQDLYNDYKRQGLDIKNNMWVITDKGSPFDTGDYRQREIQLNARGDIGGRYTAPTTNVFLLPLAILAPERVMPILRIAKAMNDKGDISEDVFLRLAPFLYYMAADLGKDKVTFILPKSLKEFAMWAEQLIEESLGKDGKGITIFYEEDLSKDVIRSQENNDRVFVRFNVSTSRAQQDLWDYLNANDYPTVEINIPNLNHIGGVMLGLERAVLAIAYLWDICAVNQKAVQGYKIASKESYEQAIAEGRDVIEPEHWQYSKFNGLNIYYGTLLEAGILTKREIEIGLKKIGRNFNDAAAVYAVVTDLLEEKTGFEAAELIAYSESAEVQDVFKEARTGIFTNLLKIPTKVGKGPAKNHSYHQNVRDGKNMWFSTYYKPNKFAQPKTRKFDSNQIKAQAIGTTEDLISSGRSVILISSESTADDSVSDLRSFFKAVRDYVEMINAKRTSPVDVLAQRITVKQGAQTGEVSMENVIEAGANGVIIGHSEARGNFKRESDTQINRQLKSAIANGAKRIILCVGETEKEKNEGRALDVVRKQIALGLKDVDAKALAKAGIDLIIAYEPRWAIGGSGKGQEATAEDAQYMSAKIRQYAAGMEHLGVIFARKMRILYGGSANAKNAKEYLSKPDVDGLLVGGKSTSVADFLPIIEAAAEVGPTQGRIPYIGGNWKTYKIKNTDAEFAEVLRGINVDNVEVGIAPALSNITNLRESLDIAFNMNLSKARENYRYVSISMGGDKLAVSLNDADNNIIDHKEVRWKDAFGAGKVMDVKADEIMRLVADTIKDLLLKNNVSRGIINKVSANLPGSISKEKGILGYDLPVQNLPFGNKYPFRAVLGKKLSAYGIKADILMCNDAEGAVNGESYSPKGMLVRHKSGGVTIIGGGMNSAVKKNDKVYFGPQGEIKEVGHNIIRILDSDGKFHYKWVGTETLGTHPIEIGVSDEHTIQKSGEKGREYVNNPDNFKEKYPNYPIIDLSKGESDVEDRLSGLNIDRRLAEAGLSDDYTVRNLTDKAKQGDVTAINWIKDIGREVGQAHAALFAAYADESFIYNWVLISGVSENLGKGVREAGSQEDIFMDSVRAGLIEELTEYFGMEREKAEKIAKGMVRSQMTYERELISYRPTDADIKNVPGVNMFEMMREAIEITKAQVKDLGGIVSEEVIAGLQRSI